MKTFTIEQLRSWDPCYNPTRYLPENWSGTALDILDVKDCSFSDRLWVIMRTELVSEKLMRLFAVWCARQVQDKLTDPRSKMAIDVAERFANGEVDDAARSAAESAAWSAARSAAESAAWSAAESAARSAARSAAESAAWSAARSAAESAARSAAESAARSAAWSAAESAARSAARSAQEIKLREMLLAGIETGDTK